MAAEDREAGDDMVAGADIADIRADLLDDAGGFMAEHGGGGRGVVAVDIVEVRLADPDGRGADQHLAGTGIGDLDLLDGERAVRAPEHGGFHRMSPRSGPPPLAPLRNGGGNPVVLAATAALCRRAPPP